MADSVPTSELFRIVPTAIIYKPGRKFLLARRKLTAKVHPGKWNVPGGGVSTGDFVHDPTTYEGQWYNVVGKTLRREVKEEVGLDIGECTFLLDLAFIRPDGVPVIVMSYYAPYVSGEVILDEGTIDAAWVTAEEAATYDLIPGTLDEIKEVEKILRERGE